MLDKIKQLTKDTALYGISTIIGRFLGFILVPFYTNVFSPTEFGIQSYIYAFLAFANIVYIYGMDAAFMKFATVDENNKKKVYSTGYIFVTITTLIFSIFLFGTYKWIANETDLTNYSHIFLYVIGILFLDTATLIPFSNLRLERKAFKFALIKILNILINVSLNFILILKYKYGIEAIFISNLVASAFAFVVLISDIFRNLNFTIDKFYLKKMLFFGVTYLPASVASMIVQVIDVPIIRELTNESTLGIYRANYKLGIFMMLFVSMFHYAWQPFFLTNAKEENAKKIFSKVLSLFLIFTSFMWIVLSLFIDDIASFQFYHGRSLIGKEYLSGIYIVPIILLAYIFHGLYINFIAGIYLEEKTKYLPAITGVGALINIVSNFILVPVIGIFGGAISTLLSYVFMSIGIFIVSQKFYKIDYEFSLILKVIFTIIFISGIFYYFVFTSGITFSIKIILLGIYFLSFLVFKIVNKKDIISTINLIFRRKK
ncbi:MAG: oligosaccharide flippase family protein [Ignavibacteriae bacterium]|nr:oligosaccharide flippase family protein [Ignavibacteriota bacterium]